MGGGGCGGGRGGGMGDLGRYNMYILTNALTCGGEGMLVLYFRSISS